jgi:hypothetical protein
MASKKLVLPGQQVSIQRPTGEIDAIWYEKLRGMLDQLNSVTGGAGGGGAAIIITGDVTGSGSGTVPTTVIKLQGHSVSAAVPSVNQVLEWDGSAWTPTNLPAAPPFIAPVSTVAALSPSGPIGAIYYVTDGASGLGWAANVVGGGTARYLVWYNGSHWTVVGDGGYAPVTAAHPTYYIYGF